VYKEKITHRKQRVKNSTCPEHSSTGSTAHQFLI